MNGRRDTKCAARSRASARATRWWSTIRRGRAADPGDPCAAVVEPASRAGSDELGLGVELDAHRPRRFDALRRGRPEQRARRIDDDHVPPGGGGRDVPPDLVGRVSDLAVGRDRWRARARRSPARSSSGIPHGGSPTAPLNPARIQRSAPRPSRPAWPRVAARADRPRHGERRSRPRSTHRPRRRRCGPTSAGPSATRPRSAATRPARHSRRARSPTLPRCPRVHRNEQRCPIAPARAPARATLRRQCWRNPLSAQLRCCPTTRGQAASERVSIEIVAALAAATAKAERTRVHGLRCRRAEINSRPASHAHKPNAMSLEKPASKAHAPASTNIRGSRSWRPRR